MLKAKEELEQYLEKEFYKITSDTEVCRKICDYCKDTYEIPRAITSDYLSFREVLTEASEFVLFCLLDSLETVLGQKRSQIQTYFVDKEINVYKASKFKVDKIKFPLKFKMIQISDDQWIGKIDFRMLMKLRAAQLIVYNENTQRTLQKIIRNEKEVYKIDINHSSVESIKKLYESETYIPTPLTLNIPHDTEFDFYYNDETNELVIKSLDHFDITDGYHRYIGACKACDSNKYFNYQMELRIVNFSEDKAKQFIYQEDQKTKMKKVDSDSLNMNKAANIAVTRINESSQCNLKGLIRRNGGLINFGNMADLVHYFYFKGITKDKERTVMISTVKDLIDDFNMLTEYDTKYLEKTYSYKQLVSIMFCFNYFKDKDKTNMCEIVDEVVKRAKGIDNTKFYSKVAKKSMMNEIEKLLMEVL